MSSRNPVRRIVLPTALDHAALCRGILSAEAWEPGPAQLHISAQGPFERVEPGALVMLAAWVAWHRLRQTELSWDLSLRSPLTYRSGLLHALMGPPTTEAEYMPGVFPAQHVPDERGRRDVFQRVATVLGLETLEHHRAPFSWILSEALNNVFEHADSVLGCFVAARYSARGDRVTLAVADCGVGIPTSIQRRYPNLIDDRAALHHAVQPTVSGASASGVGARVSGDATNAGLGLFVIHQIVARSGGLMTLISGKACLQARTIEDVQVNAFEPGWPGTLAVVSFRPSLVAGQERSVRDWITRGMRANRKTEPTSWGPGPDSAVRCPVPPTMGEMVEDKAIAVRLQREVILPAISRGQPVCIDFGDAFLASHSCVHALLYQAIREAGPGEGSRRLIYVQAHKRAGQIKDLVRLVGYMAASNLAGSGQPDVFRELDPGGNDDEPHEPW